MKQVNLYALTSIKSPNRQRGAIAFVLEAMTDKGPATLTNVRLIEGRTRNEAELSVLIEALKRIKEPCRLTVYTESDYIAAGISWLERWKLSGWKGAKGKEIANKAGWMEFDALISAHQTDIQAGKPHPYKEWLRQQLKNVNKRDKDEERRRFDEKREKQVKNRRKRDKDKERERFSNNKKEERHVKIKTGESQRI